ncbi:hypothetical protein ACQ4PT_019279 [Festuca glaucescens]
MESNSSLPMQPEESLPGEVVREILVRLKDDAATLFRCATACKAWRCLVGDPSFLRRCWPEDTRDSIAGFFTLEQRQGKRVGRPCFIPMARSAIRRHVLSALVRPPPSACKVLDYAEPVASRHGLLMVRLYADGSRVNPLHLAVCNLLTGECHVLPPLKRAGPVESFRRWNGYAVLSGADYNGNSMSFKVAVIDSKHNLRTFTSGEARWSAPTKCFDDASTHFYCAASCTAVVRHGTVHWLYHDWRTRGLCTLDMDAETGNVVTNGIRLDLFDDGTCQLCLTVVDGMLSLIRIKLEGSEIMIRKSVGITRSTEWVYTQKKHLPKKLTRRISDHYMLEEKYGMMIVHDSSGHVYVADFEDDTVELLDWPRLDAFRQHVVSFQMDRVVFFLSRLWSQVAR